jgi:hypothetical protein
MFAKTDRRRWPALRDALPLPLAWQKDAEHSSRLPQKLLQLAERILNQLSGTHAPVTSGRWAVQLHPEIDDGRVDLSGLDDLLEVDSAWAALAGSLIVAAAGGRPDPLVWATGAWRDRSGVMPVRLEAKLQLAAEFGLRKLFVPASQQNECETWAAANRSRNTPEFGTLQEGTTDALSALRSLAAELDVPPGKGESPEQRREWYLRQTSETRAERYYRTNLLPDIAKRLRRQWLKNGTVCSHVVTILSDSPTLAWLAPKVTGARCCLVLYTKGRNEQEEQEKLAALDWLKESLAEQCHIAGRHFTSVEQLVANCEQVIDSFTASADPRAVVLDLTPGTKEMTLELALSAARPGNRLMYIRHERHRRRPVPFSEQLVLWSATGVLRR